MNKKRKNVITKAKILPNKFIGKISPKNRENYSQKHSKMFYFKMRKFNNIDFSKTLNFQKTFYFYVIYNNFQKTKKFIEFGILRSIIL